MEASKFYELREKLEQFKDHIGYNEDYADKVDAVMEILDSEIREYEIEKEEQIRQDIENDNQE